VPIVFSSAFPLFSEGVVNRKVFGSVLSVTGVPLEDVTVTVEMETIGGSTVPMGEAETDAVGAYEFTYDPEDFSPQLLRVTLSSIDGSPRQVVVSPAWNEEVNFKVGSSAAKGVPRYSEVTQRLTQALAPSQSVLTELDTVGVARASILAGVTPNEAALLRDAQASEALAEVPASLFFALGKAGLSGRVSDLAKQSPKDRQIALARAVAAGAPPGEAQAAAEDALADLSEVMLDSALEESATVANPGLALTLAGVTDPEIQRSTLAAWVAHTGDVEQFWAGLTTLSSNEKTSVKFALELDRLTRSNAPMITALFGTHSTIADLATLDLDDWTTLATTHPGPACTGCCW